MTILCIAGNVRALRQIMEFDEPLPDFLDLKIIRITNADNLFYRHICAKPHVIRGRLIGESNVKIWDKRSLLPTSQKRTLYEGF